MQPSPQSNGSCPRQCGPSLASVSPRLEVQGLGAVAHVVVMMHKAF